MRVRAADGSETLLKVVRNPVTAHLPVGAVVAGLEVGGELIDAFDLPVRLGAVAGGSGGGGGGSGGGAAGGGAPPAAPAPARDVVFVLGAMSHGDISPAYTTATFSLSRYPLSAACAVGKLLNAFEHAWGVL